MKKGLVPVVVLLFLAVMIGFAVMPNTPAASKKLSGEITEAMNSGHKVFLQLSSTGCVTCRKMQPQFDKLQAVYADSDTYKIFHVDVDAHPSISSKYGVTTIPTQVVLSKEGKEIFRNMGYVSFEALSGLLIKMKDM